MRPNSINQRKVPMQTIKKIKSNKKMCQKNNKSKIVSILLPEHPRCKNEKSRSNNKQLPEKPRNVRTSGNTMNMKIPIPEIEESRSGKEASTPQGIVSVAGHSKNLLYIDSRASIHILFNKELMRGLVNLKSLSRFKLVINQFICHKSSPYIKHYNIYLFQ